MTVLSSRDPKPIPITVFTGFLGAGKTSVILSLLPRLPKDYKVVLLKNEFGDVEVDSQLAKQSSLAAVSEILNGCMCCVLVGQMKTALLEIRGNDLVRLKTALKGLANNLLEKFRPDRIIIECSGSAFPATLAFQIRELERETERDLRLDAILTVIDAENFAGYEDTSPTARMQASYTDMILINKWEHISERALDILLDHLNTLNDLTPKIKCEGRQGVDPSLIFGLDSKLFQDEKQVDTSHHDEVQTVTVFKGEAPSHKHHHSDDKPCHCHSSNDSSEAEPTPTEDATHVEESILTKALSTLSKETVWRVKGFVTTEKGRFILNWAFGRFDLIPLDEGTENTSSGTVKFTMMGERGEVKRSAKKLAEALGASIQ